MDGVEKNERLYKSSHCHHNRLSDWRMAIFWSIEGLVMAGMKDFDANWDKINQTLDAIERKFSYLQERLKQAESDVQWMSEHLDRIGKEFSIIGVSRFSVGNYVIQKYNELQKELEVRKRVVEYLANYLADERKTPYFNEYYPELQEPEYWIKKAIESVEEKEGKR